MRFYFSIFRLIVFIKFNCGGIIFFPVVGIVVKHSIESNGTVMDRIAMPPPNIGETISISDGGCLGPGVIGVYRGLKKPIVAIMSAISFSMGKS
jgi:hypothetical protein